ncbi:hypothetical protein LCGC14_0469760 [marine sediment metagenome]|uniref:Uncharacterized protein n=1 Tax=marine sediment metagenome TaxID=412755 RepID=A0A0F9UZD3_9ZZZZ
MTTSQKRENKAEQILIEEFIKDLESTALQVQKLLEDIRDSKIDFVAIKTELKFLVDNVKELSSIIRDGNGSGSVLTRLALIERSIEDIKHYIEKDSENDAALATRIALLEQKVETLTSYMKEQKKKETENASKQKTTETDSAGKWKLYTIIATGVFTLLGSIVALIVSLL